MKITEYLKNRILFADGAMGTALQKAGLTAGELPERLNITRPQLITEIHRGYFNAGSNFVCANTFGANPFKFGEEELEEIIKSAMENARAAKRESFGKQEKWIALDIGPLGRMLKPNGDLSFSDAVEAFKKVVLLGVKYGADLVYIETMNDGYETKAAVLAAKENSSLPVFVSNAYDKDGKLLSGATPQAVIAMLEGLGADAIGVNCSFGPKALAPVVEQYLKYSSLPVLFKPNAGLPRAVGEKTVYDVGAEEFSEQVTALIKKGVRIAGGCCGTDADYIEKLTQRAKDITPIPVTKKEITVISSYSRAVEFGVSPVLIGERINPTGKKRLKAALVSGDYDYVLKEAIDQQEAGAHALDVNAGLPDIDEEKTLCELIVRLQGVTDLPLQIDTSSAPAMEAALRVYNGKPLINSVNGKKESMQSVFPLVKKYGGVVVCLTLDENGIPEKAEDRLSIAEKIVKTARSYGIGLKDLIFDPLTLTVATDPQAGKETLRAVRLITEKLGAKTSLGVSNVSFGLPQREIINGAFFSAALSAGLSAGIVNPFSAEIVKAYRAFCAISGTADGVNNYIEFADSLVSDGSSSFSDKAVKDLKSAIKRGLKDSAAAMTKELLLSTPATEIINGEIIPALDEVGVGFENKTVYLPQLLASAEAAKSAFSVIKAHFGNRSADKCAFVIATVQGDIHDIGKNIVRLLLENYGFAVTDLGKDVPPERVAEKAVELHAPLVGLSALMTTTVPAMERTVKLLREKAPRCKIVVGGAVLNAEYAKAIGADAYAKDAMETVRYAESVFNELQKDGE